jgi:hypothetical protein
MIAYPIFLIRFAACTEHRTAGMTREITIINYPIRAQFYSVAAIVSITNLRLNYCLLNEFPSFIYQPILDFTKV